jgi:hypothetical protein
MQARRFQGGFHLAPSSCTCTALTTTPWTLTQAEMMIVRTESSHAREAQKFNQSRFIIIHIRGTPYFLGFMHGSISAFLLLSIRVSFVHSDVFVKNINLVWCILFRGWLKPEFFPLSKLRFYCLDSRFFTVHNTPFFFVYKVRHDMALSSKLDFDHLFLLYYIFYGYINI